MTQAMDFRGSEPILVRMAALSRGKLSNVTLPYSAENTSSAEIVNYIKSLVRDPVIREAVAVSSASLSLTLNKINRGEEVSPRRLMSAAVSLTRYMLRITGRPTPFGLNAGIMRASIGDSASVSSFGSDTKTVRPDAGWYRALQQTLLAERQVRRQTDVVMNNLCFVRGGRLIVPFVVGNWGHEGAETGRTTGDELSMRYTKVISAVEESARRPIGYVALLRKLSEEFTDVDYLTIDAALNELIRSQVLLTSFDAQDVDEGSVGDTMEIQESGSPTAHSLSALQDAFKAYEKEPAGCGLDQWEELKKRAAAVPVSLPREATQVDLRLNAEITLPRTVVSEVESYAATMWKISVPHGSPSAMHEYHEAFVERYGLDCAVPLPRVVDAHAGLGFPRGYLNPRVSHSARIPQQNQAGQRVAEEERLVTLGELVHGALRNPARELVVDEDIINMLADDDSDSVLPRSLELCFQLMASSSHSLNSGDFHLVTSPMVGAPTAGATMGRFARMLEISDEVTSLIDRSHDGAISAQVTFQPRTPRMQNVAQVPQLVPYEIPIGRFPRDARNSIDWRELFLVGDRRGLRLFWEKTGQEVIPVVPHMLRLDTEAPNLARFLSELRYASERKIWQPWKWGQYKSHPVLPRVTMGRVVASLLTWRPSQRMMASASDPAAWEAAVAEWRHDLEVTEHVRVSVRDKSYDLDLGQRFHREILRRNMITNNLTITEDPRNIGSYGWSDGRSNELVFPLITNEVSRRGTLVELADVERAEEHTHPLDSEWIFLQISAVPEVHDRILIEFEQLLQNIAESIDNWFFIRYYAPEPHIRLRLHVASPELRDRVWDLLLACMRRLRESGLARGFTHCEYEPETARYGGAEALPLAEHVFCIDSRIVLAELARMNARQGTVDRDRKSVV